MVHQAGPLGRHCLQEKSRTGTILPLVPPVPARLCCWPSAIPCVGWADGALTLDPVVVTGSRVEDRSSTCRRHRGGGCVAHQRRPGPRQCLRALAGVPGISVANRQNYAQDLQISSRGFGARSAFGCAGAPGGRRHPGLDARRPGPGGHLQPRPRRAHGGDARADVGGVWQLGGRRDPAVHPRGQGRPSVEGGFSAGSYGSWKADLAADGQAGGVGYVIDASRFATEGYRDHSRAERDQLIAKLSLAPSDDGKLTLVASSFRQEAQDPLGPDWASYLRDPRSVDRRRCSSTPASPSTSSRAASTTCIASASSALRGVGLRRQARR